MMDATMPTAVSAQELPPLVWASAFETGNAKLDSEHSELLVDINDLTRLLCESRGRPDVVTLSRLLRDKCLAHFLEEEDALARSKYPKLAAHAREHRRIERELDDVLACISGVARPSRAEVEAVLHLRSMLIHHFFRHDIAYKSHLHARSDGQRPRDAR